MPRERTKFTKERPISPASPEATQRLFVAVDFPEQHKAVLADLLLHLKSQKLAVRWIQANAAHLTLQFIGEVPTETAELLRLGFGALGTNLPAPKLRIDGAGAFPSLERPEIIWLGLSGDIARLRALVRASETHLLNFDIQPELREFHPHITLGRSREKLQSPEIRALVSAMRTGAVKRRLTALEEPFTVDQIKLYRSHLGSEGATYVELASSRLDTTREEIEPSQETST
jgi:2'-5' RNA ligase